MRKAVPFAVVAFLCLIIVCANASTITVIPGVTLSANPAALAAFDRAANRWSAVLNDPVTVNINADLANMNSSSILGSTSSVLLLAPYSLIRDQMVADAATEPDDGIVAALPTAAQFGGYLPAGFSFNGYMAGTKANLKALGFADLDHDFGVSDASMTFNSGFNFDYDSADGIMAGSYDFETIALHELGHVLGFVSSVDTVDYYAATHQTAAITMYALDLFRFRADEVPTNTAEFRSTPRNFVPGSGAAFTDTVDTWLMSTGYYTGDGRQASHWKDDALTGNYVGLMDPTLASATTEGFTNADLRALDLIGWDTKNVEPVPEPASLLLFGSGLGLLARKRNRRK